MSCGRPECREAEKNKLAVEKAKQLARQYCIDHALTTRAVVRQTANGAYTNLDPKDPRIGKQFEHVDLIVL